MATQELLRLAEANPGGLGSLDPVNDLQLKSIDVVEASLRLRGLQDSLKDFTCIRSPRFPEQVGPVVTLIFVAVFIAMTLLFLLTSEDSAGVSSAFLNASLCFYVLAVCSLPKLVFMFHLIMALIFFVCPIIFFSVHINHIRLCRK